MDGVSVWIIALDPYMQSLDILSLDWAYVCSDRKVHIYVLFQAVPDFKLLVTSQVGGHLLSSSCGRGRGFSIFNGKYSKLQLPGIARMGE